MKHIQVSNELRPIAAAPMTPQLFGNAGLEHMEKYGMCTSHLIIAVDTLVVLMVIPHLMKDFSSALTTHITMCTNVCLGTSAE